MRPESKPTALTLRAATSADAGAVEQVLRVCKLPVAGVRDPATKLWVLEDGGAIVGAVGYEARGNTALLRSLALHPDLRGRGHGKRMLDGILAQAKADGFGHAAGLTETIPDLLLRLGFIEGPQASAPDALRRSAEFQGACPDSARFFIREL